MDMSPEARRHRSPMYTGVYLQLVSLPVFIETKKGTQRLTQCESNHLKGRYDRSHEAMMI